MPRGDYSGPWGRGPMTGRGAGYCAGYSVPGYVSSAGRGRGFGRGLARGWGQRAGRGWAYQQPGFGGPAPAWGSGYVEPAGPYGPDPKREAAMLRETASILESELKDIKERLANLEDESSED